MEGRAVLPVEEQLKVITSGTMQIVPLDELKKKLEKGTPLNIKLGGKRDRDDPVGRFYEDSERGFCSKISGTDDQCASVADSVVLRRRILRS